MKKKSYAESKRDDSAWSQILGLPTMMRSALKKHIAAGKRVVLSSVIHTLNRNKYSSLGGLYKFLLLDYITKVETEGFTKTRLKKYVPLEWQEGKLLCFDSKNRKFFFRELEAEMGNDNIS